MYDYLVFIGRFQPFHAGHHHIVRQALKMAGDVILVIGSHGRARDSRNPFTTAERIEIIRSCFSTADLSRIHFAPQFDHTYNEERWIAGVQASVNSIIHRQYTPDSIKVGIVGYNKDHSSFYLKKFPTYTLVEIDPFKVDGKVISSTEMRENSFLEGNITFNDYFVNVRHFDAYQSAVSKVQIGISEEMRYISNYKKMWSNTPYPVTFNTADSIVTQSGHILLVRRDQQPGAGLWAFPGGYVNPTETIREAMIRELKEETNIDVPIPVLIGSIHRSNTYDDPNRSARGRIITNAFHLRLNDQFKLPSVRGADDAKEAKWFPLSKFVTMRNSMFEDHYSIAEHMLGL